MSKFIGSFKDFNRYIGGFCRNAIPTLTAYNRNIQNNTCQYCKRTNIELESAHIRGEERVEKMKSILNANFKVSENYYEVILEDFEKKYKESHLPIQDHFFFLCKACHRKYDKYIISTDEIRQKIENFPTVTLSPVNQRFLNTKKPIVVKNNKKLYNLNKSDALNICAKMV